MFVECTTRVEASLSQVEKSLDRVRANLEQWADLDPEMTDRLFERLRTGSSEDPLLGQLTKQERIIVEHIAEGLTNKQIADDMFLAEKTVKNYVSNVLAKMGMSRRSEAAAYVARVQAEKEGSDLPESWS